MNDGFDLVDLGAKVVPFIIIILKEAFERLRPQAPDPEFDALVTLINALFAFVEAAK